MGVSAYKNAQRIRNSGAKFAQAAFHGITATKTPIQVQRSIEFKPGARTFAHLVLSPHVDANAIRITLGKEDPEKVEA